MPNNSIRNKEKTYLLFTNLIYNVNRHVRSHKRIETKFIKYIAKKEIEQQTIIFNLVSTVGYYFIATLINVNISDSITICCGIKQ